jgi:hypothetical protein
VLIRSPPTRRRSPFNRRGQGGIWNYGGQRRIRTRPPIVPEGRNMNSRGRQPTVPSQNTFDPAGVAHSFNIPPWVCTHGYSCLTASRSEKQGRCQDALVHPPAFPFRLAALSFIARRPPDRTSPSITGLLPFRADLGRGQPGTPGRQPCKLASRGTEPPNVRIHRCATSRPPDLRGTNP